jgi:hypothetical protein
MDTCSRHTCGIRATQHQRGKMEQIAELLVQYHVTFKLCNIPSERPILNIIFFAEATLLTICRGPIFCNV